MSKSINQKLIAGKLGTTWEETQAAAEKQIKRFFFKEVVVDDAGDVYQNFGTPKEKQIGRVITNSKTWSFTTKVN